MDCAYSIKIMNTFYLFCIIINQVFNFVNKKYNYQQWYSTLSLYTMHKSINYQNAAADEELLQNVPYIFQKKYIHYKLNDFLCIDLGMSYNHSLLFNSPLIKHNLTIRRIL